MFRCVCCERVLPGEGEYDDEDDYGPMCDGCFDDELSEKENQ